MATTKTQLRAVCPVCFKDHAVRNDNMVQHGYERPEGWHQNVGACAGVARPHFGTVQGRNYALQFIKGVKQYADRQTRQAEAIKSGKVTTLSVRKGFGMRAITVDVTQSTCTEYDWNQHVKGATHRAESNARSAMQQYTAVMKYITDWVATPPRSVDVEQQATLVHFYVKRWGKWCAGSAMGAMKGFSVTDESKVTCVKCLALLARADMRKREGLTVKGTV